MNNQYDNLLANSDELNKEFVAQQQRIRELEKILEEKEQAVNDLKAKVSNALLNFKENDLTVEIKNGKVYVSLAEQLLFGSGSIKVDEKGVVALKQLARVLNENNDINILVEGHTDNVPVSRTGAYMKNNWDLSVMRATSIVNILTEEGVAPERITASGRGEFIPLTTNKDADGRKKNRRTEIILTPELDELYSKSWKLINFKLGNYLDITSAIPGSNTACHIKYMLETLVKHIFLGPAATTTGHTINHVGLVLDQVWLFVAWN